MFASMENNERKTIKLKVISQVCIIAFLYRVVQKWEHSAFCLFTTTCCLKVL